MPVFTTSAVQCCTAWALYADDLVVIAETEDALIKRLNEWKDNVENRGKYELKQDYD